MNRRDLIFLSIIVIWILYACLIIHIVPEPLVMRYLRLGAITIGLIITALLVCTFSIRRFREWGDKNIFKRNDRKRV